MLAVLARIDGYDPVAAAAVTLYAASHDDPSLCHLNGQTWWPALAKLPTLRYDLFDGAFAGAITTPSSSLTLQAEPWPNLGRYMLADARLRLWTANLGDAWGSFTLRFDGRITGQPKLQDGKAEIDFAVDDRWLDTAFLATYAGTTGIEGPAALKGQVKPLALGAPRYVPGKLIDSVNSVFQVSAYGAVQAFDYALERLARFGAAAADYATYAALIAATLAPGTWATCKAAGLARFGAPPTGQISFLLSGDSSGTDGWARKPGQLIRRIALLSGGTGKVDDTSLNALDTARPYNASLYLDEQTTAREAIQKLAASVNAVAGVSWTGQLFVLPVAIGAASTTFAADGSALPPVASVQQIEIAAPFQKLAVTAERAWTVHQLADIAFTATLVDLGGYVAGTIYREGNIVELPSGARYMYSNVTPTAGNTPPNATYWTALPDSALAPAATKLAGIADNAGTTTTIIPSTSALVVKGNTVTHTAPGTWRTFYSTDTVKGPALVSWRVGTATTMGLGGLIPFIPTSANDPDGYSPNGVTLHWDSPSNNVYGHSAAGFTGALASGQAAGDLYEIYHDDGTAYLFRNKTLLGTAAVASGLTWRFGGQILQGSIYDIKIVPYADVTPARVTGPTAKSFAFDYTGTAKAGQLPDDTVFKAALADGTDITTSAAWTATLKTGTASFTIGSATGVLNVTAISSDATIEVAAAYGGKTGKATVAVQRVLDPPPVTTGSSGGSGSAGGSASTSAIGQTTSTSYGSANSGVLTVKAGSAGAIDLTFPGSFRRTTNGTSGAYGKWQKSAAGAGSWSDVASEIGSTVSADKAGGAEPYSNAGSIAVTQTASGLTSGSDYDFRLLLRNDDAVTCNWTGTASAVAQ